MMMMNPLNNSGAKNLPVTRSVEVVEDSSMNCICDICTCGGHRCKVNKQQSSNAIVRNSYDPINSSYRSQYIPHSVEPFHRHAPVKQAVHIPSDKDHFVSEYRQLYLKHPVAPKVQRNPRSAPMADDSITPMSKPFDATSTYRAEHYPRPVELRAERPRQPPPRLKPFDATTTNQETYRRPAGDIPLGSGLRAVKGLALGNTIFPERLPFDGQSTYRAEYLKKDSNPLTNRVRPPMEYASSPDNRDFVTTNGQDYQRRKVPLCPVMMLNGPSIPQPSGHVHYRRTEIMQARVKAGLNE